MLHHTTLPSFTLESGHTLRSVPVTYGQWGLLNARGDNVVLVCHALTGSADAADWWGTLIGPGKLIDTHRFCVICVNTPGSPYGTISPLTTDPATGRAFGPTFPAITIRDTARLQRALLFEHLGVRQVALALGGSMGGMMVLEWGFFGDDVRALAPMATSGRHAPWCIGWSEAQRQAIYADPNWRDGHYPPDEPPARGLSVARMIAMPTYRAPAEFEERFGRERERAEAPFAVESYLRHQGAKLAARFDANCYVALTRQMDTHDVARGRGRYPEVLSQIPHPTLVVGIASDVLYPLAEQALLARHLPAAHLAVLDAPYGHDAFLLDFEGLQRALCPFMHTHLPDAFPARANGCPEFTTVSS